MKRFLMLLGFVSFGIAATAQKLGPENFTTPTNIAAPFWNVPAVKAILFLPSEKQVITNALVASGIQVQGLGKLDNAGFKNRMKRYLGKPMNFQTMKALQAEIVQYMREHDRPLMDAVYPPQEVTSGVLQVVVTEARLNNVIWLNPLTNATGSNLLSQKTTLTNRWVNQQYLSNTFRLRRGDVVDSKIIEEDLDWLSRSPFRDVGTKPGDAFYGKGRAANSADVFIRVHETKPWDTYVGYENSGSKATDFNRVLAGFDVGKAIGPAEHLFNYQFTADPNLDHLRAHSANYGIMLPWRHTLRVFGYYLDVNGEIDTSPSLPPVIVSGRSFQTSLRYEVPLPRWRGYQHEFAFGVDYKRIGSTLEFNGSIAQDSPWDVFQPTLSYVGSLTDTMGRTTLTAQGAYSPGGVTGNNSSDAYTKVIPGSDSQYAFVHLRLERLFRLKADFLVLLRAGVQFADGSLLPSEQLGLGGRQNVRGFPEREVNADEGWYAGAEILSPALHLAPSKYREDEGLRLAGFYNYGVGTLKNPPPGEEDRYLGAVGIGLRYRLGRHISIEFNTALRTAQGGFTPSSGLSSDITARLTF